MIFRSLYETVFVFVLVVAAVGVFCIISTAIVDRARIRALSERGCSTITHVDRSKNPCDWSVR